MTIHLLFLFAMCHAIGDYAFQGEYLSSTKGKNWVLLAMHALSYTFPFALVMFLMKDVNYTALYVIAGSHFIIDPLKTRWRLLQWIFITYRVHAGEMLVHAGLIKPLTQEINGAVTPIAPENLRDMDIRKLFRVDGQPYFTHETYAATLDQVLHFAVILGVVLFLFT